MGARIRAKVARVLNSREIVINAGKNKNVIVGMYFDVMDSKGEDVADPDTGEILGSIERPKVRVKVTQVQDRISVASTFRKKNINVGGVGYWDIGSISRSFLPPKIVSTYETLKTDEQTWEDIDEEKSFVKTGDPVLQVTEEERLEEEAL